MSAERLVKWSKEAQEFFEKANITDQEKSNDCKTNLQTKLYVNKILQYIPGCIYWKDVNGTYLGCNQMEAEILGLKSSDEIVGKTVYDLANQQTAKSPLYDDEGNVTGIIGVSLDITEKKKAEELQNELERKKVKELQNKLKMQEELYEIAKGVAHDICSPISALGIVKYMSIDKLGKEEKEMFEMAVRSIRNISDTLIKKYRSTKGGGSAVVDDKADKADDQYIAPYSMKEIIEVKRYQYRDKKDISINFYPDNNNKFVFIKGNMTSFQRLISNLLNNEVEAIEGKEGEIEVWYEVKGEEVEVRIKDNGEGGCRVRW